MKRIYIFLLAAMFTSLVIGQSVEIVADSHEGDVETAPGSFMSNSSFFIYSGKGVNSWTTNFTYYDTEVWVSDGKAANTRMLEINSTWKTVESTTYGTHREDNSAGYTYQILFNDKVYFSATNGESNHIYYIDGIAGDTVRALNDAWTSRVVADNENGKVYLTESGSGPWKVWDGVNLNAPVELPYQFHEVDGVDTLIVNNTSGACLLGDKIIFAGTYVDATLDDATGKELFVYDLTGTDGPVLVKDIKTGGSNSSPSKFVELNNMVYFIASDDDDTKRLWKTNGTPEGTEKVLVSIDGVDNWTVDVNAQPFVFDGKLYFEGDDDNSATDALDQLYEYDPEFNTLTRISGLVDAYKAGLETPEYDFINFDPNSFVVLDNTLYFIADYSYVEEGKTYDSATEAIYKLTDSSVEIIEETIGYQPSELIVFDNKIYFAGEDENATLGEELYVYDPTGTPTAIEPVSKNNSVAVSPNPSYGTLNISGLVGVATYELYNLGGQMVEKGMVVNGVVDYSVTKGIYLLKVSSSEVSKTFKIIVK